MSTHIVKLDKNYTGRSGSYLPKEVWLPCTLGRLFDTDFANGDGCVVYIDGYSVSISSYKRWPHLAAIVVKKVGGKK